MRYNLPKYKFILDINGEKNVVYPLHKDDISLEKEKEGDYEFFRTKWSGKLTFIKRGYELIRDADFETVFSLEIQLRNYETGAYEEYYTGGFVKTDLEFFDEDERVVLKKLETYDVYKPILDGLRNEYNMIELKPDKSSLVFNNRPLWQFYIKNGTHVLNVLGGTYWETEVEPTDDYDILYVISKFRERLVTGIVDGEEITISVYARMLHNVPRVTADDRWDLVFWDVANYEIPEEDFVGQEVTGYKYMIRWDQYWHDIPQFAFIRQEAQDEISEYGRISEGCTNAGKFFPQATQGGKNMIPLNKSLWGCYSVWIDYSAIENFYRPEYKYEGLFNQEFVYPFVYKLSEVLRVFVQKLNPDVTHEATPEYSEFLYGNSANNIISGGQYTLLMTPKSNFLTKNADQPATRAITTLDDILKDLFASHKLQWHIDEDNRFRVEHVKWYDNGGRYEGTPNIQIDLTQWFSRKTRKPWAYLQNNHKYDKSSMPERFQFEWSESVSPAFEAKPIEIISEYVEKNRKEEIGVRIFTTDVEYMIANSGDISKNNFALFAGIVTEDSNELFGADSDMSAPNNWASYGTTSFNVNTTISGKMWVKVLANQQILNGVWINPNNYGGTYTEGLEYDINLKSRLVSGSGRVFLAVYTLKDGHIGAVAETFEITSIEQTFNIKNIRAISDIFVIKAFYYDGDIEFSLDDIEILRSDTYYMPLKEFTINNFKFHLQNADLAWKFLHEKFWAYTMPAPNIIINGVQTVAQTLMKGKEREIEFPYLTDPNNIELIKTIDGNGEIKKLSINLLSRKIKATLKYDTE